VTLHVYAVTEHPAKLPETNGIDQSPLEAVQVDGFDVIVSEVAAPATETAIVAHARVVDDVLASNDAVLPARFGGGVDDVAALRETIRDREDKFHDALEQVRGNIEIGLRVAAAAAPRARADEAPSGHAYLTSRLADVQASERVAREIHAPLAAAAQADMLNVLATPELLLSAAYLIPRADVDAFRARVEELDIEHPELVFVCTGPWPPYSFATVEAGGP
jgi:Gas vesicle synthesis protein GvpL/GvpF